MRILLIGSAGVLSSAVFQFLCHADDALGAVAVHQASAIKPGSLIMTDSDDIGLLALQNQLPVIDMSDEAQAIAQIQSLAIDMILVACYGHRVPSSIIELAALGSYNIHPSLLPRFRGPEPVFWQFKHAAQFGVSLHRLTESFDAGDIVCQQPVSLADGCSYQQANRELARAAVSLTESLLSDIASHSLTAQPQDETQASYQPFPQAGDFQFSSEQSARDIYNFVCGTRYFQLDYQCQLADALIMVSDVIAFDMHGALDAPTAERDGYLTIQCNPGILTVKIAT